MRMSHRLSGRRPVRLFVAIPLPTTANAPVRIFAGLALIALVAQPAMAQDVRGFENCMAEKQIERRTGCLQANIELMQQTLTKLGRETQQRLNAASAEIAALRQRAEASEMETAALKDKLLRHQKKIEELQTMTEQKK